MTPSTLQKHERNQTQSTTHCMVSFIGNVLQKQICRDSKQTRGCLGLRVATGMSYKYSAISHLCHTQNEYWWLVTELTLLFRESVSTAERLWGQAEGVGRGTGDGAQGGALQRDWELGRS